MDVFEQAFEKLMKHEGGYVNDPDDRGGETRYGISQRAYPDLDIKSLTLSAAKEIYRRDYWERPGFSLVADSRLAARIFDLGVNVGPYDVARWLQQAANALGADLAEDGLLGPKTLFWVNGFRQPAALVCLLKVQAGMYYLSLDQPKFLAGWLCRLDSE